MKKGEGLRIIVKGLSFSNNPKEDLATIAGMIQKDLRRILFDLSVFGNYQDKTLILETKNYFFHPLPNTIKMIKEYFEGQKRKGVSIAIEIPKPAYEYFYGEQKPFNKEV